MIFRFVFETDMGVEDKFPIVSALLKNLENFIEESKVGIGIDFVGVRIILKRPPPGFEKFSIAKRPSYKEVQKFVNPLSGTVIYNGYYTFDLKFSNESYDRIVTGGEQEIYEAVFSEIKLSADSFALLKKKVKNANVSELFNVIDKYFLNLLSR